MLPHPLLLRSFWRGNGQASKAGESAFNVLSSSNVPAAQSVERGDKMEATDGQQFIDHVNSAAESLQSARHSLKSAISSSDPTHLHSALEGLEVSIQSFAEGLTVIVERLQKDGE
jgi:hypothetical protein